MKIIAFYLPQFHEIPENDKWWGKGFTEWVNVRKATQLFKGHNQPRIPLNKNYYNLLDDNVKIWQVELAKKYGVYGFCYYHYWFNGKILLEKPMEQMLRNKKIDLPFCICWANEPWTKAWVNKREVLIPQFYGSKKEWKEHFEYLLPFMKDKRYIWVSGKPFVVIYRAEVINCLNEMLDYWQELALEEGFPGLTFAYQAINFDLIKKRDDSRFEFDIEFQPSYAIHDMSREKGIKSTKLWNGLRSLKQKTYSLFEKKVGFDLERYYNMGKNSTAVRIIDYHKVWNAVLLRVPKTDKNLPGAFVDWDNTPRRKMHGTAYTGCTPEIFEKYLTLQIKRAKDIYHKDMLFMYAWNEWAEGGYLEPDEMNGYGYLQAIKNSLDTNNEFPH